MNCKNVQARLSAYVDRELTGFEMHDMRDHLNGCATCREEEVGYRTLKTLLGGVGSIEPSKDFADRLVGGVLRSCPSATVVPRRRPAYLLAAFAAAAAMTATTLILPAFRATPVIRTEPNAAASNDYALEISRDQLYEASGDPLSGGHLASPAVYGR